jgi:hypothetical protein
MANQILTMFGTNFVDGDIVALPKVYPNRRGFDGKMKNPESLFLVIYDEEHDEMVFEPISWRLAQRFLDRDALHAVVEPLRVY